MSVQISNCPKNEYEMIEYPGLVKNVDKMIETLGGITKISQTLGGETKQLELRYHPENPFNKGVHGNCNKRAGLLISIKVRRSKKQPTKLVHYDVNILGYINKSFTFESLCDFQYLPLAPKVDGNNTTTLQMALNSIIPKSVVDLDFFDRTGVPLMSVPTAFARSDTVHYGIFRGDFSKESGQNDVLGVCYKANFESRDIVNFNMLDNFPTRPDPQLLKRMKVKYVSDEQFEKVKKLFDECPIWTRIALLYESGITNDKLKCITPSMAYYFSNGPWRTFYVRYGYDPRKDFQSRFYQTFDFRVRFRTGIAEFVSDRKTSLKKQRQLENQYEMASLVHDVDYPYFDEDKLPRSRQCILRYCDIRIAKIQEMLEKIPSPLAGAMCNERTGWLPSGFDAQVRQILSNSVKDLLRSRCRREQTHSEIDSGEIGDGSAEPIEVESISDMDVDVDDGNGDGDVDGDDFMNDNDVEDFLHDMELDVHETNPR